jgi:hypothetical protein
MERVRRLWAGVLCQAYQDLRDEEFGSYWHNQAVAFFFDGGDWIESRRDICDMLGLHPSDLARPALRMINARRLEHGLPPLATQAPQPSLGPRLPTQRGSRPAPAVPPIPLPRLVATFKEPEPEPERTRGGTRNWRTRYAFNPFDPWRRLPSEAKLADSAAD